MNADKDIENREWYTRFRGVMAVHASKGMTSIEYGNAWDFMYYEIDTEIPDLIPGIHSIQRGVILGTVEIVDCVYKSDSPWFEGTYGFVLKNPRRLVEPVPCKGALGLWEVPKEIEAQFRF